MAAIEEDSVSRTASAKAAEVKAALSNLPRNFLQRKKAGGFGLAPRILEIILLALLCFMSARFFWLLFAPLPIADTLPPVVRPVVAPDALAVKSPFGRMASAAVAPVEEKPLDDVQETSLDLKLHGTWLDGESSTAIISANDKQKSFSIDEEVLDGVTLEAVYANQVTISNRGVLETLKLPKDVAGQSAHLQRVGASTSIPAKIANEATSFMEVVRFEASADSFGEPAIKVFAAKDRKRFTALGLRNGDIVRTVEGQRIKNIADALPKLAGKDSVKVLVERDGRPVELTVRLRPGNELN